MPGAAFADKCKASACLVYHEQDVPNAGGQQGPPPTQPQGGSTPTGGQHTKIPTKVSKVLAQVGPDRGPLSRLLTGSGRSASPAEAGDVAAPSALGAAFDLGSGPTALLAILVATAAALAIHNSWRGLRRKRPSA